jgi:pimeloyl-ACP methyl ester carboxylesterase
VRICLLLLLCLLYVADLRANQLVCLHGFINDARSMHCVIKVAEKSGFRVYAWSYPSRKRKLENHALSLALYLNFLASRSPGEPIHFVTHSIGALVLRAALNHPACPMEAKIGKAILIAPANQGSQLARRYAHKVWARLALGSGMGWQLMQEDGASLERFGTFPCTMSVLVIAGTYGNLCLFSGPNDGWLALEETYLSTPFILRTFPCSHGDLLKERAALAEMRNFLVE